MIPIRDINPSRGTPVVCYGIIAACTLMFLYEILLGAGLPRFLVKYGLVPVRYTVPHLAAHFSLSEQLLPFLTSMFLHGGWLHLIGNMWILYIFGDNLEGELGHGRFLLFYILSGVVAALIHLFTNPGSSLPTVGASGSIAGVMGAYFLLYPGARILAVIPLFIFLYPVELPAFIFLGFWFVMQFFSGAFSLVGSDGEAGGIAWWAHVGGFLGGMLLLPAFLGKHRRPPPRRLLR